jgi:hypothetical protein
VLEEDRAVVDAVEVAERPRPGERRRVPALVEQGDLLAERHLAGVLEPRIEVAEVHPRLRPRTGWSIVTARTGERKDGEGRPPGRPVSSGNGSRARPFAVRVRGTPCRVRRTGTAPEAIEEVP